MNKKTYCIVSAVIFLVVMILHAARTFLGWEVSINGWIVPIWVSWGGLLVSGFLAWTGFVLTMPDSQ
ncbi:MAG: hypothetical protein A3D65_02150 [Candidatus Lloydbacteria bacterium RIFCSPHIGHO2_02_FULL_50_13]|uniref:Uncharacterized protein n=1 Tax=Candidatus Lloydbacteria bacterium RIFCSPHIGHO2_02_FULL_50_13 TaxID=1798661 RepID=A0A1G2D0V7_9BACT|nr:MAG: hypothetical protein A3D65_02150 [Candidatus Lloydbacteria bacterium RIFCSPHIGHO2_02_FULL_50_13]